MITFDRVRVYDEMQTPDGAWSVQVARYADGGIWYRVVGPDAIHEKQAIGTVKAILAEAGIDMGDLRQVKQTA